eukprot:TRINITY_DN64482_c1_g1_i1.p1 TRINITY_DN64482_c1_g1~~TRINITY_DN64482_c1_g1_i1.p1  ORF type:complete len:696 (-),score=98.02 TRINITY_DN64482_c1_g1_i1:131-2218(-)
MDDSEDETIDDYKIGGYHPVHVGEIFMYRYIVIQKLGWGHFSTVWLAKDLRYNTFVALKIQKSAPHYLEAAYDEVEILEQVSSYWKKPEWEESAKKYLGAIYKQNNMDSCFCVQLLNSFLHYGPNGKHFVMVFEIMGVNLLDIIRRYNYKGIPIPLVRIIAKQVLIGLDYLHRICKIIHTDLKPENVLLSLTREQINEIRSKGQLGKRIKFRLPVYICGKEEETKCNGKLKEESEGRKMSRVDPKTGRELTDQEVLKKQKKKQKKKRQKQRKKEREKAVKTDAAAEPVANEKPKDELTTTATTLAVPEPKPATKPEKEEKKSSVALQQQSDRKMNTYLEEELIMEKPRSRSLPNMVPSAETGAYYLEPIGEDFAMEIEQYLQLKAVQNQPTMNLPEETFKPMNVRNPIDEDIKTKIVDLGNGCWTYHHFTSQIQTRQYRSPEVILGANYGTSADIWSFACMIFELITGEFLFEPRKSKTYGKDDDHLAQVLLERVNKLDDRIVGEDAEGFCLSRQKLQGMYGRQSLRQKFFDRKGCLRRIQGFHFWSLKRLLMEKYMIKEEEAKPLADFLLPMLEWYPDRRATAQDMLSHYWLNIPKNYDYKMSEKEYRKISLKKSIEDIPQDEGKGDLMESDVELNKADIEDNGENLTRDMDESESDLSETEGDPASKKYSLQSDLLNVDHGPNPQFESLKELI